MKFKLIVADFLDPTTGNFFVIDGARAAVLGYNPAPFIDVETDPLRLILCHPADVKRVREALDDSDMEEVF